MASNNPYIQPAQFIPSQTSIYQQSTPGSHVPVSSQFQAQNTQWNNNYQINNSGMPICQQTAQMSMSNIQPQPLFTQPPVQAQPLHQQSTSQTQQHLDNISIASYESYEAESEFEITTVKVNEWQSVPERKRKRGKLQTPKNAGTQISQQNRYSVLAGTGNDENNDSTLKKQNQIPKPPPIFVHGVTDYVKMVKAIQGIAEIEQYQTKTMANNVVKINTTTPETYRKLVKYMKDSNIIHHTYQMKEEKAYRVVIRNLHPTTPIADIKEALLKFGHKTRIATNITHRVSKQPLPMFYVDLEPSENNKEVYNLRAINNQIIKVEPPRRNHSIVQCTRCQQYNHTKTYCNLPYKCVKCGESHDTKSCNKARDVPARCALCGGDHPANYRGCAVHKELQNKMKQSTQPPYRKRQISQTQQQGTQNTNTLQQQNNRTYSQATKQENSNVQQNGDITLNNFLDEFKNMFRQLLQQNNMILQMLTTVINKLVNND